MPRMLGKFYSLLFACSSSFQSCSTYGHRGPDPSGTGPSRPFLLLILLLCLLMGMSSKYLGGGGAVEVGLGRGSAVLSPEPNSCSCRTCNHDVLPGHPSCYRSIQLHGMDWSINSDQCGGISTGGSSVGDAKGAGKLILVQVLCVQAEDSVLKSLPVLVLVLVDGQDCLN